MAVSLVVAKPVVRVFRVGDTDNRGVCLDWLRNLTMRVAFPGWYTDMSHGPCLRRTS